MTRPVVVQMGMMLNSSQHELDMRYDVRKLPRRLHVQQNWLHTHGQSARAVLTPAHVGISLSQANLMPNLEIVAICGIGQDCVDVDAIRDRGITITNTPYASTADVAELAIALMLNVFRNIPSAFDFVRSGRWAHEVPRLGRRSSSLRYGIVGLGHIGTAIAERLAGFGGSIAYTGRRARDVPWSYYPSILELAQQSDVLFLALPSTPETRSVIGAAELRALGSSGVLVNVARGAVVDENALIAALRQGDLWGAGLDVTSTEPSVSPALLALENVIVLPHVGASTLEAVTAMEAAAIAELDRHFFGMASPPRGSGARLRAWVPSAFAQP
ncbi:2-hydroxyacid dehydrogenase [Nguyenibacter vanlangensis]|uniref:2-hydroxyacid dehydrogenase n=1 Tax=Nguyenibacter vanlangensis TaxID=1216886 RepID=A0ABZ3D2J7_9PROT